MKSELQVSYLGTTFCKVDSSNLSDEALNAKVPKKGAMGRPKSKKPKPSESNLGEDTSKNEGEEEVALLFYGLCFISYSKNLLFCLCVIMGTKNWNVLDFRISNSDKKWNAIRDHLSESNCDVLCLQETKHVSIDLAFIQNFCPPTYGHFEFLPSNGTSDGSGKVHFFTGTLSFKTPMLLQWSSFLCIIMLLGF